MSCRTDADFKLWLTRVLGIIGGCSFAMAVTWLVLPTYASDEHLELLADAFEAAADLFDRFYDGFHSSCKAAACADGQQLPTEDFAKVCSDAFHAFVLEALLLVFQDERLALHITLPLVQGVA